MMEENAQKVQEAIQNAHDASSQCLSFMLAGEEYAVDILAVQEIRGWERATPIPNAPADVRGIINLRGTIVPIIDMRKRFSLESREHSDTTVVIILRSMSEEKRRRTVGIIVDAVSDVYDTSTVTMRPAAVGENTNSRFIKGLMSVKNRMLIFLDLHHLLSIH